MQVGDLVKEKTKLAFNGVPSLGVVLEVGNHNYLVHFFDDNDKCWMKPVHLEAISESR